MIRSFASHLSLYRMWSKQRTVNDGVRGYLNSFGFTLLAIKYLQEMDIVPIIRYDVDCEHLEVIREAHPLRNEYNLGHLVWGFFNFWSFTFDAHRHIVSILSPGLLSKPPLHRSLVVLLDPIRSEQNVARNIGCNQWQHTVSEMQRSADILRGINDDAEEVAARFRALIQDTVVLSYSDYVLPSNCKHSKMYVMVLIG